MYDYGPQGNLQHYGTYKQEPNLNNYSTILVFICYHGWL